MRVSRNIFKIFFKLFTIVLSIILFVSMSPGGQKNTSKDPAFVKLEKDEASYSASIYDEQSITEVKDISFSGHISIGGIRSEADDSVSVLDFSKIKELTILKPSYESKRYSDREFILASAIANNGSVIENLLIPKEVIICAIETSTNVEKAWLLQKINKLVIDREQDSLNLPATEPKKELTFLERIGSGFKKIVNKISY